MKIAVTGGTGFIGHHLVKRLLRDQHQVHLLVHNRTSDKKPGEQLIFHSGSVEDQDSLIRAFDGVDVVYHLVGIIVETKSKTHRKTVVEGTRKVISACRECGVSKLVYLSALGTRPEARSRYHQAKYAAEQSVIGSGLEFFIARPSVVYGEGDGFVSMLSQMIKWMPVTPVPGDGRSLFQPVYVGDVVELLARVLDRPNVWGETIDVGGPQILEYLDILAMIKKVLNRKRLNLHVPMPVMKVVALVAEMLFTPAPVTRDQLLMMQEGSTGDIDKMKQIFNIEPERMVDVLPRLMR